MGVTSFMEPSEKRDFTWFMAEASEQRDRMWCMEASEQRDFMWLIWSHSCFRGTCAVSIRTFATIHSILHLTFNIGLINLV